MSIPVLRLSFVTVYFCIHWEQHENIYLLFNGTLDVSIHFREVYLIDIMSLVKIIFGFHEFDTLASVKNMESRHFLRTFNNHRK
jgi:hypothetical protein